MIRPQNLLIYLNMGIFSIIFYYIYIYFIIQLFSDKNEDNE